MLNYVHYVVLSVHRLKLTASLVTRLRKGGHTGRNLNLTSSLVSGHQQTGRGTQGDVVAATGKAQTSSESRLQPTATDELGADGWGRRRRGEARSREPRATADSRRWEPRNNGS